MTDPSPTELRRFLTVALILAATVGVQAGAVIDWWPGWVARVGLILGVGLMVVVGFEKKGKG